MNCMKCGVEIPEGQVFCDHCLEIMNQHPIKPDAHVHLPKRSLAPEPPKKVQKKKRNLSPEEIISALKLRILRLRLVVVILIFLLCVIGGLFAMNLYQQYTEPTTGRNYTIDVTMGK